MDDEYSDQIAGHYIDLSNQSESEQIISSSDEEPSRRVMNDHRLTQAIHYLKGEGGDDSPVRYMERVARINTDLVQRLPQQGEDFDLALHRHLQAVVRAELTAFQRAKQEVWSAALERDENLTPEDEEFMLQNQILEDYSSPVTPALHRSDERLSDPKTKHPGTQRKTHEKVQYARKFHYGGPMSEIERWYSNFPAILPFPETYQLAHWESLKIDFDLSELGKKLKAEGKVVETNVSFDHPALQQYKNLPLYESGSRFKLPTPPKEVEDAVNRLCTEKQLAKLVDEFNRGDEKEELRKNYVPRIFLDKFTFQKQDGPTEIRRAVNVSPIKAPKTSPRTRERRKNVPDDKIRDALEGVQSAEKKVCAAREKVHKAALETCKMTGQASSRNSSSRTFAPSPVARKINRERERSIERSPRRQSGISTAPPSPATPINAPMLLQHKLPHPDESIKSATDILQSTPTPAAVSTPKSTTRTTVKRKRSIGELAYTPERKRKKFTSFDKTVRFEAEEDSEDTTSDSTIAATSYKRKKTARKSTPRLFKKACPKPGIDSGVKMASTTMIAKKESKATAAGKAVHEAQAKKVVEDHVDDDEHKQRMEE